MAARPNIGRPRLPPAQRRDQIIPLRVTMADRERVVSAAATAGKTITEFVDTAVFAAVDAIEAATAGKTITEFVDTAVFAAVEAIEATTPRK